MNKIRVICLIILSFLAISSLAKIVGTVQNSQIYTDQPFQFTITSDQPIHPDLSPLEKNFRIIGQSTGQQVSYINGQQSRLFQYIYTLVVNTSNLNSSKDKTGILLPSIKAGNENTRAIQLTVLKPSNTVKSAHDVEAKIEVSFTPEKPYVQQEILLNIDIYLDEHTANLIQAMKLSPVNIENTLVKEFPQPQIYRKKIDGKPMVIVVKKLAIFPQNSGEVFIPPITFAASILDEEQNRNPHSLLASSFFQQTKTFRVTSDPLRIDIQPRPSNYNGTWIPTSKLILSDSYSPIKNKYEVGETINRTITISADNLLAEQLPEISPTDIKNINIYSAKPEYNNSDADGNIFGERLQTFTYLATKPGQYSLPEIKINWFNTQTGKADSTTLPAKTITVIPTTSNIVTKNHNVDDSSKAIPNESTSSPLKHTEFIINHLGLIFITLLIILGFIALYIYLRLKNKKTHHLNPGFTKRLSIRSSLCLLEKAFKSNDAKEAKQAYLYFINTLNNKQLNKRDLNNNLSPETKNALNELDIDVYGNDPDKKNIDLKHLYNLIKKDIERILKQKKLNDKNKKNDLPDFYEK
jgi:hypothetical protein